MECGIPDSYYDSSDSKESTHSSKAMDIAMLIQQMENEVYYPVELVEEVIDYRLNLDPREIPSRLFQAVRSIIAHRPNIKPTARDGVSFLLGTTHTL